MVNEILKLIAKISYKYGKEGAGMPSFRGIYELEVPAELAGHGDAEDEVDN